jgi:outer membrane biosynthesis protein TonB
MRVKINHKKITALVVLGLLFVLLISACELQSNSSILPATPTMPLEIPIIAAETNVDEEAAAEEPVETAPEADTETEAEDAVASDEGEEAPAPTETPKPKPTATKEPVEAEGEPEEEVDAEPTPTEIPYVYTANSDPMVMVYGSTNCYKAADADSEVIGVAIGGTALGASERQWNWYKVVHPTTGGLVCWVTGDSIRPNQTAYNLGD